MAKRILVVDDEPNLLRAVAMTLRVAGHDVRTAADGVEALVRLAESTPDLIITDIRMPRVDGHTLVQQLRESPSTRLIPIVFLTAKDTTADRVAGFRAGADYYLTKPFEPEELIAVVGNILDRVERTHTEIARLVGVGKPDESEPIPDEDLTPAEEKVAIAVARGLRNKEIAAEFHVSTRTVETHIRRIMLKKQFSSRVEIARYVLERGLLGT
jgi:DNA-binding NarL/FixJ family response regulator